MRNKTVDYRITSSKVDSNTHFSIVKEKNDRLEGRSQVQICEKCSEMAQKVISDGRLLYIKLALV